MVFNQVRRGRISDNIVEQIKNAIFTGIYKPGDKLPSENELKKLFNISRVPLREALRCLQEIGFVTTRPGVLGGTFVVQMGTRSVSDPLFNMFQLGYITIGQIWDFRLLIEPSICRLAAQHRSDWDIKQIEDTVSIREKVVKHGKTPVISNIDFHQTVARATKNPIAVIILDALAGILMSEFKKLNFSINDHKSIIKFHRDIFECIKKKDARRAGDLMEAHLLDIKRRLNI